MADVRGLASLLLLWLSVESVALAQAPDSEQVFAPLIEQAERDQQAGRLTEARARANAFLQRVSVGSPLAGRAHLVISASESVGRRPEPSADVLFEPLVIAAEADAVAGRNAVALARLSAAMSLVPADSPLAARARNLYALVSRAVGSTPPAPAPTPAPTPPPVAAPQPQVIVLTQQAPAPAPVAPPPVPVSAPKATPPTPDSSDAHRLHTAEMAELRVAGGALGLLIGINTLTLLNADDPLLFLTIPLFTTVGLVLVTGLLDSGGQMPHGVPAAISTGVLVGFGDGLLIWGLGRNHIDTAAGVLSVLTATTAAGALVGAAFGYGLSPTIAESRLVLSAGAWGVWLALMSALSFDSSTDRTWGSSLIAYNVGVGTAMLVSSLTDVSMARVAFTNGALVGGALLGLMVAGVIFGEANQNNRKVDGSVFTASLAIGSTVGLIAGMLLPESDVDGSQSSVVRTLVRADLDVVVAPSTHGMTLGITAKL